MTPSPEAPATPHLFYTYQPRVTTTAKPYARRPPRVPAELFSDRPLDEAIVPNVAGITSQHILAAWMGTAFTLRRPPHRTHASR